jgi:tetratricopeptide (TPR) repeat protein
MMHRSQIFIFFAAAVIFLFSGCSDKRTDAVNLLNDGAQLAKEGKIDEAIVKYQEGLKIDPDNHMGYNLLGMAYRYKFNQLGAQKYKDLEIEAFQKAIELEPDFWVAYKNLAASFYYQGRKKEAVPYLEKALELQPNDPEKEIILQWIEEGKQ